jgi:hypothetical protein
MTQTFSGGCVYEFFADVNDYGLVWYARDEEFALPKMPNWMRQTHKEVKRHGTEDGTLRVLEDFVNYKEALDGTTDVEPSTEEDAGGVDRQSTNVHTAVDVSMIPASCVDFAQLMQEATV